MTAGTFKVNVSGPSMHVIVRVSVPSSPRTCFRRTKQTKHSKRGTCTILLCTRDSGAALGGHVDSAFPSGSCVQGICRSVGCCFRVTVKSNVNYAFTFGLSRFYHGFGRFPMRTSDTLGVLAHTKCLRCASRRSGTSHVLFAVGHSRLCGLRRGSASARGLVGVVLHSCAKLFASCTCVGRSSLMVHSKLAHRQVCRVLLTLAHERVVRCVPQGGAPCVVCAHRQRRGGHLTLAQRVCRSQGGDCAAQVGTVVRCTATSSGYHDQVLLECFKRGGRRGYKRYSMYLGGRRSKVGRKRFRRLRRRVGRLLRTNTVPTSRLLGRLGDGHRGTRGMLSCLLSRRVVRLGSKVLSMWVMSLPLVCWPFAPARRRGGTFNGRLSFCQLCCLYPGREDATRPSADFRAEQAGRFA